MARTLNQNIKATLFPWLAKKQPMIDTSDGDVNAGYGVPSDDEDPATLNGYVTDPTEQPANEDPNVAPYFQTFPTGEEDWKSVFSASQDTSTRPRIVGEEQPVDVGGLGQTEEEPFDFSGNGLGDNAPELKMSPYEAARRKYQDAYQPAKKQNPLANGIFVGLQAAKKFFNDYRGIPDDGKPVQWLGEYKRDQNIKKAAGEFIPLEQQKLRDQAYRTQEVKNQTTLEDDRRLRENSVSTNRKRVMDRIAKNGFDPALATPSQIADLKSIGLTPQDVGKINLTHPTLRSVGGINYAWNPQTGSFDQTDLPTDLPKQFTTMEVVDADGKSMGTYNVSEKDAADFKSRLAVMGYQTKVDARKRSDDAKRRNLELKQKFEQGKRDAIEKRSKRDSELTGLDKKITDLQAANATKQKEIDERRDKITIAQGDTETDRSKEITALESEIQQIQSTIDSNDKEYRDVTTAKEAKSKEEILDPVEPQYESEEVDLPSPSGLANVGGTPRFTEAEIRAGGKAKNMTDAQINAKIAEADKNGWLVK